MNDRTVRPKAAIYNHSARVDSLDIFSNDGSNVERYDEWQRYFRGHQPPALVVRGKGDVVFAEACAEAYRKDLATLEIDLLAAGHFALETKAVRIADYSRAFLGVHVA